ncbi:patatin-like phospholipase family protein [Nocardiopsis protaetiae]|uniref:patatin-like phospholipase family protein n=1 Tax=Nocardiopsis protaetiae TaxID=3382270 RepID=UPI00387A97E4
MTTHSGRTRGSRIALAATAATAALTLAACSAPAEDAPAEEPGERPRVGIVLGGGGEVGIAWQTGVLAALAEESGLTPDVVDVVVGTSAGAFSGAQFAFGLDPDSLVEAERAGGVLSAPVGGGSTDEMPIPAELLEALASTEGTIEERGRRVGEMAIEAPVGISSEEYVAFVAAGLPGAQWPEFDSRATSVNALTGETVLWTADDGVPLAAALASSSAVPGFLPVVEIDGAPYTDVPRTSFSRELVEEKDLDAIVYIGMPTPNLSNTVEEDALDALEDEGLLVVRITGTDASNAVAADALNPEARPEAVELGLDEGRAAAAEVTAILG